MTKKENVIIIGAGVGGLFCGAILSKEGYHVRVFEQHYQIGGGLHQFKIDDVEFETGMHVAAAFHEGGVLNRLCSYLGIMEQLTVLPTDDDCFELLHIGADHKTYKMPKGRKQYTEKLINDFPDEKENIERYLHAIYNICDNIKLYNLEYSDNIYQENAPELIVSVGDFINSFTQNERLRTVLSFSNPLYAGDRFKTPAFVHAMISKFYIEGAVRFVGGSRQLADALAKVITDAGGEVQPKNGVVNIEIEDKAISYIETADGQKHTADMYISSIHPSSLFNILDKSKLQKSYWKRIDSIPNSYSVFCAFIIFKPECFKFFNHTCYYLDDDDANWQHEVYNEDNWPRGMMYLTPPVTENDCFAEKMIVNCIMKYDTVRKWEHTFTGERGDEYETFKKQCVNKIINKLEKIYPDIRNCIKSVYSSSPLTIRDYYNQKEGAIYGSKQDCNNMALSHISIRTKLNNLLLTGQNINLHGILGVPLTAIRTCAELLGMEYIINKINFNNDK